MAANVWRKFVDEVVRAKHSNQFWIAFAFVVCSLFFVLFQGGKVALMVFIIVSLLSIYVGLGRWSGITKAQGSRSLVNAEHDILEAGTSLTVRLNVQVPGVWPLPYVLMKDRLVRRNGHELAFESSFIPDWKRRGEVEYSTPPLHRGYYQFDRTECVTEDIFGLFEHKGELALSQSFCVKPQTVQIKEWKQFRQMSKGHFHHAITTQALKETTQINGVREYIYGDRISRIHWNATARTGTWKSKEYERESLPKTIVVLDRTASAYKSKDQFELAVSTAASLFDYGFPQGMAMGLLSAGQDMTLIEPKRGQSQQKNISAHLIEVEANSTRPLLAVMKEQSRHLPQGGIFVIISPSADEAMLQTMSWLRGKQMLPCQILVGSAEAPISRYEWHQLLKSKGMIGYSVRTLQELPAALA